LTGQCGSFAPNSLTAYEDAIGQRWRVGGAEASRITMVTVAMTIVLVGALGTVQELDR